MTTAVIMDVIAAAVLLAFILCGARRGLLRSVAGLAVLALSLVGAGIFASTVTPSLAQRVLPYIEQRVESRLDAALAEQTPPEDGDVSLPEESAGTLPESGASAPAAGGAPMPEEDVTAAGGESLLQVQTLLGLLGLDEDPAASIADAAREKAVDAGTSVTMAVVESVAETVLHTLLFFLAFALLTVLLNILLRAMDLVTKLPGIHLLNRLGGAVIGLAEGALAAFLAIWIARRLGISFDTQLVQDTVLLKFFATHTPLSALSFL